jgi:hypothetical protein
MARETKYDLPKCGVCGELTRPKFAPPRGGSKNSRSQHSRWRVCERGHQLYRKRG